MKNLTPVILRRTIPDDDAKLLFAFLDKDGTNFISEEEFMNFGNVMMLQFDRVDSYMTWVEKHFNNFYNSVGYQVRAKWLRRMLISHDLHSQSCAALLQCHTITQI